MGSQIGRTCRRRYYLRNGRVRTWCAGWGLGHCVGECIETFSIFFIHINKELKLLLYCINLSLGINNPARQAGLGVIYILTLRTLDR